MENLIKLNASNVNGTTTNATFIINENRILSSESYSDTSTIVKYRHIDDVIYNLIIIKSYADFKTLIAIPKATSFIEVDSISVNGSQSNSIIVLQTENIIWVDSIGDGAQSMVTYVESGDIKKIVVNDSLDEIITATGTAFSLIKRKKYVVGLHGITGCDYNFTSVANTTQQSIRLGGADIIPSDSVVSSLISKCLATTVGGTITTDIGITSGSSEYMSSVDMSTINTEKSVSAQLDAKSSASSVYFSVIPSANWNTLTVGKWLITIYYNDASV